MKNAVQYLENNPDVDNEYILELAWEQLEDIVDDLLKKITSNATTAEINKELHKWLYCIMKDLDIHASDEEIFHRIEEVFSMFQTASFLMKGSRVDVFDSTNQAAERIIRCMVTSILMNAIVSFLCLVLVVQKN